MLASALCAWPDIGCAQDQDRAPARDVTRSKAIRTYRPLTPADFFKQEAVRFERARIDMNGSIVADGHNLSLYGVVLLRRDKICTAAEGARWACGQRAFLALRSLLEGRPITCRFTHVTMPPKAVCSVGDIDITLFLLSRGWAELADDVTETTSSRPWPLRRARRLESGAAALDRRRTGARGERAVTVTRNQAGQFTTGWTGGPGRPAGQRNKLSETFLSALANDFREHGQAAIERVRNERPHHYLSVIASLCPRQLHVERTSPLGELSDAELEFLQETLAARQAKLVQAIEPADEPMNTPTPPV